MFVTLNDYNFKNLQILFIYYQTFKKMRLKH